MAASSPGRMILIGIGLGITIGAIVGLLGAIFEWPMAVRGGIVGALIVIAFAVLRRRAAAADASRPSAAAGGDAG